MSMKKKFLALALAGAVAMPVVANASTVLSGPEDNPLEQNVSITGSIDSADGLAPQGTLQVEVPTAMAFSVNKAGVFQAADNYDIVNNSKTAIKVDVTEFRETQPSTGVTVVSKSTLQNNQAQHNRATVALTLRGDAAVELVESGFSETPLFNKIDAGKSKTITLEGIAGTKVTGAGSSQQEDPVKDGTSEQLIVKFRISKHS